MSLSLRDLGTKTTCLNLGSYNYLGFAEKEGPCAEAAINSIHEYGAGTNSSRVDLGRKDTHRPPVHPLIIMFIL